MRQDVDASTAYGGGDIEAIAPFAPIQEAILLCLTEMDRGEGVFGWQVRARLGLTGFACAGALQRLKKKGLVSPMTHGRWTLTRMEKTG